MMCFYRSYCLDLFVALVDCQVEGCASHLNHVYQGGYVAMHKIDLDEVDWKICFDCVDKLWMGGKLEKLKKVQITVYRTDESEEDREEVEGVMLRYGGEEVSIVPVVYPCGTVSVSSLGSFSFIGSSS